MYDLGQDSPCFLFPSVLISISYSFECQGGSLDLIPPALLKRSEPLGPVVRTTITVELPGGSVVYPVGGT